ncbi:hypothetical protein M758_8G097900 [Ceratodon purpureus]|nr:hypothetical protein M758_8G097900 [Ceratodon purpureus]
MTLAYMSVPDAYGVVESGVYRAKTLDVHNLPFLLHLQIRTVVYLSPEPLATAVTDFLNTNKIKLIHLGVGVWMPPASWKPINEELIKDALEIVLDVTTHPVLVMCLAGIHATGTVVGCLRRLQEWNLTPILEEYRRYAKSNARYANEQFMELFDEDLVTLPEHLPEWFIDQRRMMEEEEAEFAEQLRQEQASELGAQLQGGMFTKGETTNEVQAIAETEKPKVVLSNGADTPGYKKYYYSSSSPLTTENRSYKRKIIGKV